MNNEEWDQLWSKAHQHLAGLPYLREQSELRHLAKLLDGVKSFVDVGASYGPYTWVAHYLGQDRSITSIEANPVFAAHIGNEWAEVERSGAGRGNSIRVISQPVSNEEEELMFQMDPVQPFNSFIVGTKEDSGVDVAGRIPLRTVMLDKVFKDTSPDLIKIDIEGAEWRALDGCRSLVGRRLTRFLLEIHPWGDASISKRPSDIFRFFRENHYTVERINTHWHFKPVKPSLANRAASWAYGFVLDNPGLKKFLKKVLRVKA